MEIVAIAYSKAQQTQHNRIKPKKESTFGKVKSSFKYARVSKKSKATAQERDYLSWLQEQDYPCFSCGKRNGIEWHHVKRDSTSRKDHTRLIPLCGVECHRLGAELSAHSTPVKFREVYPIDYQMEKAKDIYMDYVKSIL